MHQCRIQKITRRRLIMNPEKVNSKIINEANELLYDKRLLHILKKLGVPYVSGSYSLGFNRKVIF